MSNATICKTRRPKRLAQLCAETIARQSKRIEEILDKNIEDGLVPPEERETRMAKIMEASKQFGASSPPRGERTEEGESMEAHVNVP